MFQTKVVEKTKIHISCSTLIQENLAFRHNVGNYNRSGQATGDNITRRMCFTCRIPKATDTTQNI